MSRLIRTERTLSLFAFFDASFMACLGAFCFLLFFWYLDAYWGNICCLLAQNVYESTHLCFCVILREVVLGGNKFEKGFKRLIVFFK